MSLRERLPGLIQHVLTVLVFRSCALLLPRFPPSSRSLKLFPWASILLHGPFPYRPCKKKGRTAHAFTAQGGAHAESLERSHKGFFANFLLSQKHCLGPERPNKQENAYTFFFMGLSRDCPRTSHLSRDLSRDCPGIFHEISWEFCLCVSPFWPRKRSHTQTNLTPRRTRDNPGKLTMFTGFFPPNIFPLQKHVLCIPFLDVW